MAFGPEMVAAWSSDISEEFKNKRIARLDFGEKWMVMQFTNHSRALFFSLDPEYYGIASIGKASAKLLVSHFSRPLRVEQTFKKHITGAKLVACTQINNDRILEIAFEKTLGAGFSQRYYVVFEIMAHKSNLILMTEEKKIIDAIKLKSFDGRSSSLVLQGTVYSPPAPIEGATLAEIRRNLPSELPQRLVGVGKHLEKKIKELWNQYTPETWRKWLSKMIYSPENMEHISFQKIGNYITFFPIILPGADPIMAQSQKAIEFTKAFVFYPLLQKESTALKNTILEPLLAEMHLYKARIEGLANLVTMAQKSEQWMKMGNLLIAWQHNIPSNSEEVILEDWTVEPPQKITIKLNPQKSVVENAQIYFKKAKKYKDKNGEAQRLLKAYKGRYEELQETVEGIRSIDDPTQILALSKELVSHNLDKKNKRSKGLPIIRYDLEGAIIFAGINQKSNHYITFRLAKNDDIWLHVKDKPGAHVILRRTDSKGKDFSPEDPRLIFAASIAAYYSKGRSESRIAVDYTKKKHVAPQKGTVAQVTYNNYKSIMVSPTYWKKHLEEQL